MEVDELAAQLRADLDGIEFSDDEGDEDLVALAALPELPQLLSLEQHLAAAQAEAVGSCSRDGFSGGSSAIEALQAALDSAGARACGTFAADVSEMAKLTASLAIPAPRDALAAEESGDGDEEFTAVDAPWWVEERQVAWAAEAERDGERRRRQEAEEAERVAAAAAAHAKVEADAAATEVWLRNEESALQDAKAAHNSERRRIAAQREAAAAAALEERQRQAAEAATAEVAREERRAAVAAREARRQGEEAALRARLAEAEAARKRGEEQQERERLAAIRFVERREQMRLALEEAARKAQLAAEEKRQIGGASRLQAAARVLFARAMRSKLAVQAKREREEAERMAAEEATRRAAEEQAAEDAAERAAEAAARAIAAAEAERRRRVAELARREREVAARAKSESEARARREETVRRQKEEEGRVKAEVLRREVEARAREEVRRQAAASTLQAHSRGHRARCRHGVRADASRRLQRAVRAALARRGDARASMATVVQARWRGVRLRARLRAALAGAKYEDDDLDDLEEVDDSWLQNMGAHLDLDSNWMPSMPSVPLPLPPIGGARPSACTGVCAVAENAPPLSAVTHSLPVGTAAANFPASRTAAEILSASAAAISLQSCGVMGPRGSGGAAWAASHAHGTADAAAGIPQRMHHDPALSCSSSPTSERGGRFIGLVDDHEARAAAFHKKSEAIAGEWGLSDPRLAATLVKRQEKQRRLLREHEKRQAKQDPIKRFEQMRRKQQPPSAYPKPPSGPGSCTGGVLITRHEPQPPHSSGGGLRYLGTEADGGLLRPAPATEAWCSGGGAVAAVARAGGEVDDEVDEELAVSSVCEMERDMVVQRTFHSDTPNAKLARSVVGRRGDAHAAAAPARAPISLSTLAWATPPSSAGTDASATLPVGSALRVARAANGNLVEQPQPQQHANSDSAAPAASDNPFARLRAAAPPATAAVAEPRFELMTAIPFRVSMR